MVIPKYGSGGVLSRGQSKTSLTEFHLKLNVPVRIYLRCITVMDPRAFYVAAQGVRPTTSVSQMLELFLFFSSKTPHKFIFLTSFRCFHKLRSDR